MRIVVLVLAAGRGQRLGQDKAEVDLAGHRAVDLLVAGHRRAGADAVYVARRAGLSAVPNATVVEVETEEMIATVRAALSQVNDTWDALVIHPIDHPLVTLATLGAVYGAVRGLDPSNPAVVLPVCRGRGGHPLVVTRGLRETLDDPAVATLRDLARVGNGQVLGVDVDDGWTRRDIDTPSELRAARGFLANRYSVTELMSRHRSRRAYDGDPIAPSQLEWLVDSARHASTSSFIQAYSVVVVEDAERRREIATLCGGQAHIEQAPVFAAVCADLHKLEKACAMRDGEFDRSTVELFLQSSVDASLLGQNLQLAAESEGLGACMIGGARNEPEKLAELLELPNGCYVVFGMTLGWPTDDPVPRRRMPLEAVLHRERYGEVVPALEIADEQMRAWARETNQRHPDRKPVNETRGWTDRMAFLWGSDKKPKGREHLLDALRRLGFGLER